MALVGKLVLRSWTIVSVLHTCLFSLSTSERFDSWATLRNYSVRPVCVPIPANMTLCQNIGYSRLRLPNLLEHDSLSEVLQQASGWTPLLNLNCDPDTRLLLCSLYAPICLERPIYPCRSLCQQVRDNCGGVMLKWGFPWPKQLACDQFPLENDMCIKPQAQRRAATDETSEMPESSEVGTQAACRACQQPSTKRNIMEQYCRADIVLLAKIRRIKSNRLRCGKSRLLKPRTATRAQRQALRRPALDWPSGTAHCCPAVTARQGRYLIMATTGRRDRLIPTLILPWKKNRLFRSLRRVLKTHDCTGGSGILHERVAPPITTTHRRGATRRGGERRSGAGRARHRQNRNRERMVGRGQNSVN